MPLPVKSLPVVQHWDCHGCGDCCKTYHVRVSDRERDRIESQNWFADPNLAGVQTMVYDASIGCYRLNHQPTGACVFLDEQDRCRIHAKFGSAAKPMACRIYPFVLVPAGDHWRVGIRFACPSAAENKGRPLPSHLDDLREYAKLVEEDADLPVQAAGTAVLPPPELQPGQSVPWGDLVRFTQAFVNLLADDSVTLDCRMRRAIALMDLCRQAKFEKVSGGRLKEFLTVTSAAIAEDVPVDPEAVPAPGWIGRTVFRQTIALYARQDIGPHPGIARHGRWARLKSAWRFAIGRGTIPRLHALIPETTFEAAEQKTGPLPPEASDLLYRYYRVKIESMQFCGPTNFRRGYWDGLASLFLTFPAVLWLSRVLTTPERPQLEAIRQAVRMVDDNFGFNVLLGADRQVWGNRKLMERGELARLTAWYSR